MLNSGVRKVGDGLPVRTDEGDIAQGDAGAPGCRDRRFREKLTKQDIQTTDLSGGTRRSVCCAQNVLPKPAGKRNYGEVQELQVRLPRARADLQDGGIDPVADVPDMRPMTFMSL